tara:strand:+ start:1432 stop:1701 length:270 start_codon:yes stop_codon:yes gene_type:complete
MPDKAKSHLYGPTERLISIADQSGLFSSIATAAVIDIFFVPTRPTDTSSYHEMDNKKFYFSTDNPNEHANINDKNSSNRSKDSACKTMP